uniref:Retrovirus-related Pol polyprotein from transposon TNT 1-94 n=1 Tax=Cajanus cajan TaxID=3821 RepID=A0A151SPG1_CAJCA|nr:Retrovirus-related Pol polyprotein from transposon TNT 1-94 [Cajanus cajan]
MNRVLEKIWQPKGICATISKFDDQYYDHLSMHKLGHFQYECPTKESNSTNYVASGEEVLSMAYMKEELWFLMNNSDIIGDNSSMNVMGKGIVRILTNGIAHILIGVFYIPGLKNKLNSGKRYMINFIDNFIHIPECKRTKLDDRSKICIFHGVSEESKAYRLYDPISQRIIMSRGVVFEEDDSWDWSKYTKVFAPVAHMETIRMVISLADKKGWEIFQLDVMSAFLHRELNEEIFIDQPPGYQRKGAEQKVYKLKKALYGLKHALRAWYSHIGPYFVKECFKHCPYEHTLFVKVEDGGKILIMCLYVDDLVLTGNDKLV